MRYYRIDIDGKTAYTSHPSGPTGSVNPGALMVEFDIPQAPHHMPSGGASVRVWGIGLQAISQASNLNGKTIAVYGGMGVGLPLASLQAPNAGLLVQGNILAAFGNWIGVDQTLDFIISAPTGNTDNPANLVVTHQQGDKLGDVVKKTLTTAFPGFDISVNVSDKLVLDHPGAGFYQSMEQFAKIANDMSIGMFGSGAFKVNVPYPGIQMSTKGKTITVTDGQSQTSGAKTIQFYDLVGQPTWLGVNTIQVKTIMRGDIDVQNMVTMPNTQATQTSSSASQFRDNSGFQGTFMVQKVRHLGNSRQPDGNSWVTIFDMVSTGSPGGEVYSNLPTAEPSSGQTIGTPGTTPSGLVAGPN